MPLLKKALAKNEIALLFFAQGNFLQTNFIDLGNDGFVCLQFHCLILTQLGERCLEKAAEFIVHFRHMSMARRLNCVPQLAYANYFPQKPQVR